MSLLAIEVPSSSLEVLNYNEYKTPNSVKETSQIKTNSLKEVVKKQII